MPGDKDIDLGPDPFEIERIVRMTAANQTCEGLTERLVNAEVMLAYARHDRDRYKQRAKELAR